MDKNPLVSIITPSYNSEKFIRAAVESALLQTYENWEMLIIDDASRDHSAAIIENYAKRDARILPFRLKKNLGPALARNVGIEKARGDFIAFLDADDLWFAEKLSRQLNFMTTHDLAFSACSYQLINEKGKKIGRVNVCEKLTAEMILKRNPVGCVGAIYSASKLGKQYMKNLLSGEDLCLWFDILKQGARAKGQREILAAHRIRKHSASADKFASIKNRWKIYREAGLGFWKRVYFSLTYILHALQRRYFSKHG